MAEELTGQEWVTERELVDIDNAVATCAAQIVIT